MRKMMSLVMAAVMVLGLAVTSASAAGQQRDRKRDGSCGNCPAAPNCPAGPNCPQVKQQEKQKGQQQKGQAGDQKRDRKRDGSCQTG